MQKIKRVIFNQVHTPFPSSNMNPEKLQEIFDSIVRSMRNASYLGVKNIVVHPVRHLLCTGNNVLENCMNSVWSFTTV